MPSNRSAGPGRRRPPGTAASSALAPNRAGQALERFSRRGPCPARRSDRSPPRRAALIAYALLYPGLGPLFGLSYPRVPSFGVPRPLSLLTVGLLLMASPRQARIAAVIPLIWTGIAGSAAFLLGIRADLALLPAGAALILQQVGPFRGSRLRVDDDRTLVVP